MAKPAFINLWNNHPTEQHPCDAGWDSQCAIRMSLTLDAERSIRIDRNTCPQAQCAHGHARGAGSLANWLWRNHRGRPQTFTDGAASKRTLNGCTGILFFKDRFTRSGEARATGGPIDLWPRGLTTTCDDPANRAAQVGFWELA